jgi:hypothetical protein
MNLISQTQLLVLRRKERKRKRSEAYHRKENKRVITRLAMKAYDDADDSGDPDDEFRRHY